MSIAAASSNTFSSAIGRGRLPQAPRDRMVINTNGSGWMKFSC